MSARVFTQNWNKQNVLPVIIVSTVKFRIPDEAGVMQTVAARAALYAPFVIWHVHDAQQETVADWSTAHAT